METETEIAKKLPHFAAGLVAGLVFLATGPAGAESSQLLPELGEIADPWDAWDAAGEKTPPPPSAVSDFDPPPAADLLPLRARPTPVHRFHTVRFEGNQAISSAVLGGLVEWILQRPADAEDLDHVRDDVTRHYIAAGHINSGAVSAGPDEKVPDVLVVRVVEGRLTHLDVRQQSGLRRSYIERRLGVGRDEILHFPTLQRRLQSLQLNPNVERVRAELRPGAELGEGRIELAIDEGRRWFFGADLHNNLPPSVGAEQLDLWFSTPNLTGLSDTLDFRYGVFSGGASAADFAPGDQARLFYGIPVFGGDTVLSTRLYRQGYVVIEEPFDELGISGETSTYEARITHSILNSAENDASVFLGLGRRSSWTELLGSRFTVSPGYVDGELDLTIGALGAEWVNRRANQVWRVETSCRIGLDWFGVTDSGLSEFFVWNGAVQYLRRMNEAGHVLSLRTAWQWADGPLPSTEQSSLGGVGSIRGYRENSLVRDDSLSASVEWRIPLPEWRGWQAEWVAFADAGVGRDEVLSSSDSLASIGAGLVFRRHDWLRGEIFWGFPLTDSTGSGSDLQDDGLHFRLSIGRF